MSMISKCGKGYVYRIYAEPSERVVSNENVLSALTTMRDVVSNSISNVAKKVQNVFDVELKFFKEIENANIHGLSSKIIKNKLKFMTTIKKTDFLTMKDIIAYVPEGMICKYSTAIAAYLEVLTYLEANLIKNMLNFNTQIGYIINNKIKENISDFVNKTHRDIMICDKAKELIVADITKLFAGHNYTETTIDKVVKNNSEWEDVIKNTEQMSLRLSKFSLKDIKDLMNVTNNLLGSLVRVLKEHDKVIMDNKEIKQIAEASYVIASQLEFFVAMNYDIIALTRAISDTMDLIIDMKN